MKYLIQLDNRKGKQLCLVTDSNQQLWSFWLTASGVLVVCGHMSSVFLQQMNLGPLTWHPAPSEAFRTPSEETPHTVRSWLQTFPPVVSETIQECARAPGFQEFCWGLHWNNILMIHVSEDRSQAQGRWLCGLAQRRTAHKTGKQTVMDRWASHGAEQPDWQSDGKQQQRIQSGILAQNVRAMLESAANNNVCLIRSGPRDWPVVPEGGEEFVERCWSGL